MTHAFETHFPDAPAIIILEDDLNVAFDFMDWFVHAGRFILESDGSVWCASAWNDNGFTELHSVRDAFRVKRTNLFPGL
jgi:hypothetical protein